MDKEIFKILVLGDFSGTFSRTRPAPSLKPLLIDRDNFEEVMNSMRVSLEVEGRRLPFRDIDDFHPDRLCQEFSLLADDEPAKAPAGDLLGAILAEQGEEDVDAEDIPVSLRDADDLSAFVERVTAGHVVPAKNEATLKRESDVLAGASDRLRAMLHAPAFQVIEGSWRALYHLVRSIETGPDLKIYALDITLPELLTHLGALRDGLTERGPWALLAGNYAFGQSDVEIGALRKIAALSKSLDAPFLAEAIPADSDEQGAAWRQFRRSPEAVWIGLALPRFLLRLPYGARTIPIENFDFEEMPRSIHAEYLWGNPVFLCASLLAQGFEASGWDMDAIPRKVEGLPLHVYSDDGEAALKPCAEVLLSQTETEYLMEAGVMPLASIKGQDAAVLVRFQSVAEPLQSLPGF